MKFSDNFKTPLGGWKSPDLLTELRSNVEGRSSSEPKPTGPRVVAEGDDAIVEYAHAPINATKVCVALTCYSVASFSYMAYPAIVTAHGLRR